MKGRNLDATNSYGCPSGAHQPGCVYQYQGDDYTTQGTVLSSVPEPSAGLAELHMPLALRLSRIYKQLEAPAGESGMRTLEASTGALAAGDPGDVIYKACDTELTALGAQRDSVSDKIAALLQAAQFSHTPITASQADPLLGGGQHVLQRAISTEEYCS